MEWLIILALFGVTAFIVAVRAADRADAEEMRNHVGGKEARREEDPQ